MIAQSQDFSACATYFAFSQLRQLFSGLWVWDPSSLMVGTKSGRGEQVIHFPMGVDSFRKDDQKNIRLSNYKSTFTVSEGNDTFLAWAADYDEEEIVSITTWS